MIRLRLADEGGENRGILDLSDDTCEVSLRWIPREIQFILVGCDVFRGCFPVRIEDVVEPRIQIPFQRNLPREGKSKGIPSGKGIPGNFGEY